VRGFFVKDRNFALQEKVATVIAQITCHDNELPQGSPCLPVISNLVGHLLDTRLARFAKFHKCTYSRYADDITFSTNRKEYPARSRSPGAAMKRASSFRRRACPSAGAGPFVSPKAMLSF
jgi:hypothetical protein